MSILLRGKKSLSQLARAILRSFAPDASSYPFSTLQGAYQTSTGPAAVAVNDPVGLELDAMGTVGPELVTNGDFSAGVTGWGWYVPFLPQTFTNVGGELHVVGDGVARALYGQSTAETMTSGKTYRIRLSVRLASGAMPTISLNAAFYGVSLITIQSAGSTTVKTYSYEVFYKASTTGSVHLTFDNYVAHDLYIDNVSIVEVTGNHATQTTAINRPTVQQDGNGRFYASFNGTNSSLQLTSVQFQMADDFAVVTCVKYGTPASWSTIFSICGAGTTPRIQLFLDNANGHAGAYFRDDAGVSTRAQGAVDLRNTTSVITLAKRGTNVYLRVNGVQVVTTSVAGLGAATFTAAAIGKLALGADYMLGGSYGVDPIKGTVTDAQLLTLEKAAGQRAGLVI